MKDSSRSNSPLTGNRGASSNEVYDEEEALPLYENLSGPSQPALPSKDATPAEVRTFLYQTLVSRHGLDEAVARETANKWKLGGGAELRSYPLSLYTGIFGPEGSWVVFRTVSIMIQDETKPERERKLRNVHIGFATAIALILVVSLILAFTQQLGWIFLAVFGIPMPLFAWLLMWSDLRKTSEQIVEWKMQSFKATDHTANVPVASGPASVERT